ncbi:hypothetical protein OHS18_20385 [Amycolatopsis sp. NBC_00355]|uniref:hypothetical protein n=1 Tax=Amycolatopsis sp. NBC_00355 TaxID=2975957 RepID=UPI002E26E173
MEIILRLLSAWARGTSRRAGANVEGLTGQALETVVRQVFAVVMEKLSDDPSIRAFLAAAKAGGDVPADAHTAALSTLERAASQDQQFAGALHELTPVRTGSGHQTAQSPQWSVTTGDISGRNVRITNRNKVVNYARRNPVAAGLSTLVLVVAMVAAVLAATRPDSGRTGAEAFAGNWTASDGSGIKVFGEDGRCEGFYYNGREQLDIGGPMTCAVSDSPGTNGRYTLTVTQQPNQATYEAALDSSDHISVYTGSGAPLYELSRH